ncbi:hypothetical protein Agub_g13259 [Astrephomene gubernaculifera]|uniref:L-ascorbate peroxidase n=1 Tax=Astrephomene gubernaculifera TaxID=47775 RepID=A0AAD3DZM0_9CHLO|nr:hypothetical protein Agub_g13259 [Astrephomene gubernaculifera]
MRGVSQRPRCTAPRVREGPQFASASRALRVRAAANAPQPNQGGEAPPAPPSPLISRRQLLSLPAPLLLLGAGALLQPAAALLPAPAAPAAHAAAAAAAGGIGAGSSGPVLPSPEVKAAVDKALAKAVTKGKAAVALRLPFHDAGTFSGSQGGGGLNASVRFELDRPENMGLKRGWRIVEQLRGDLRGTPADGCVSDADLVALAGAFAVRLCGGPDIAVPIGRPVAAGADPAGRMPGETFSAEQLKAAFADKGLSVQEMVALSGAHTLGSKGFGDPVRFDNEYYTSLLRRPWTNPDDPMASMIGLPSDHVLPDDPDCLPYIRTYAEDQDAFFRDFAAAYVKMCALGVPGWA